MTTTKVSRYRLNYGQGQIGTTRRTKREALADLHDAQRCIPEWTGCMFIERDEGPDGWFRIRF